MFPFMHLVIIIIIVRMFKIHLERNTFFGDRLIKYKFSIPLIIINL